MSRLASMCTHAAMVPGMSYAGGPRIRPRHPTPGRRSRPVPPPDAPAQARVSGPLSFLVERLAELRRHL